MTEKVIGVLGGMGPEATVDFCEKIIANTPASTDQDHLRVLIDVNPKIPDRTAAILHGGRSPVAAMSASAQALARAGADFLVIPCVSAHFFLDALRQQIALPVLSIFDLTADHIQQRHPPIQNIGLLATTGTLQGGRFQARLHQAHIHTIAPDDDDQQRVMTAIYAIKSTLNVKRRAALGKDMRAVADRLVARGAQGIIAGCTEIPLVLKSRNLAVPLFDTLLLLARAAIVAAGREPIPLTQES